jgi:protein-tyrosine phosphatase
MKSVIFVCLGNICRSPLAEGIARKFAQDRGLELSIDSAGTGNWHVGEAPCEHSVAIAQEHGVEIGHLRARQVKREDFEVFELVIALDESNYNDLKRMGASPVKLGMYGHDGQDVPDPYFFKGYEGFEKVFTMIESCVELLFDEHFGHPIR